MPKNGGIIGVSDHGGWAVLVTVARDGALLDRRRVELVGEGLPKIPHRCDTRTQCRSGDHKRARRRVL